MLCRPSQMFSSESCSEIMMIWSSWSDGMYKILEFLGYFRMNSGRNEAKVSINIRGIYNCLFKTPTIICTSFYWLPYSGKFATPLDMYNPYAKWALIQTLTWTMFVLKVRLNEGILNHHWPNKISSLLNNQWTTTSNHLSILSSSIYHFHLFGPA